MTISDLHPPRRRGSRGLATPEALDAALPTTAEDLERVKRRLLRLAFDVHDGPLQSLAAAGFGLNDIQERLSQLPIEPALRDGVTEMVAEIVHELAETERTLRGLVSTLEEARPEIPLAREIVDAEIERFGRRSSATVVIEGDWHVQPDSRSQALTLEALLRESLTNIAKHAKASSVTVRLQWSKTHALVEIQDDGIGFEVEQTSLSTIGLTSMRERVRLLGGHFEILSRAGGPTVITAILPRWRRKTSAADYTEPAIARRLERSA
jgi:signal transduction histidine kinase